MLDDGELVDRQPVIGVGVVEIDQPRVLAADGAVSAPYFDRHALDQIASAGGGFLRLSKGVSDCSTLVKTSSRVSAARLGLSRSDGGAQTLDQHDFAVAGAFRLWAVRADVEPVGVA